MLTKGTVLLCLVLLTEVVLWKTGTRSISDSSFLYPLLLPAELPFFFFSPNSLKHIPEMSVWGRRVRVPRLLMNKTLWWILVNWTFSFRQWSPLLSLLLPFELLRRGGDVKCCPATLPSSVPELPEGWIALTRWGGGENARGSWLSLLNLKVQQWYYFTSETTQFWDI